MSAGEDRGGLRGLCLAGGIAALLQPGVLIGYGVVIGILGSKPETAEAYLAVHQASRWAALLRGDLMLLGLIGLYLLTAPAIYAALRRISPASVGLATLGTIVAVILSLGGESMLSLLHLGDRHALATSEAERALLRGAIEAVIASDMWSSTAAYASGILLQGSGAIVSAVMFHSPDFRKITAGSGLLSNGLDLVQHVIHPLLPAASGLIQSIMGPPYLVWFVALGLDLLRIGRAGRLADGGAGA